MSYAVFVVVLFLSRMSIADGVSTPAASEIGSGDISDSTSSIPPLITTTKPHSRLPKLPDERQPPPPSGSGGGGGGGAYHPSSAAGGGGGTTLLHYDPTTIAIVGVGSVVLLIVLAMLLRRTRTRSVTYDTLTNDLVRYEAGHGGGGIGAWSDGEEVEEVVVLNDNGHRSAASLSEGDDFVIYERKHD